MTSQQLFAGPTEAAVVLVMTVDPGATDEVREFLPDVGGLRRSVGSRTADGELSCVVGLGSDLWDRLVDGPRPAELHSFREIAGAKHTAVSTAGDLVFHIRARRMDLCFELAARIVRRLRDCVAVVDEVHGFRYFDERDLIGFVDGTENPTGADAVAAAVIGDEDPAFAGGSYLIVQKYFHDLPAWCALPVAEQERVVGRTKSDNLELPDDEKPTNSHVALNVVTDHDGAELAILRHNLSFGRVGDDEYGTYFIGYAASPDVTELMLRNMFIGRPPGNHDRILDYSKAVTGSLFFVPPAEFLDG